MSAQLQTRMADEYRFQPMSKSHLDQVAAIESSIYQYPWTYRNFSDSLDEGYCAEILLSHSSRQQEPGLIGYFVLMPAVDEAHLLNISVAAAHQKKGYGRKLLQRAVALAHQHETTSIILEVRVSNKRANEIYRHYGFEPIGIRKGYYPHSDIDSSLREDAIVMRLDLA